MDGSAADQALVSGLGRRAKTALFTSLMFLAVAACIANMVIGLGGRAAHPGVGYFVVVMFAGTGVLGLWGVWMRRRPLAVKGGSFLVPAGHLRRSIPIPEVSGVGLVLSWLRGGVGRPIGWYLTIWDADGHPILVEESCLRARSPAENGDPRESSEQIAASAAGQMAKRVYDLVRATQGSSGMLATRQEQKIREAEAWSRDSSFHAWWSPDGEMFPGPGSGDTGD